MHPQVSEAAKNPNMENLNFRGGNPGAVQFGNFINYYQFHPPEDRIGILPEGIWNGSKPFVALDIGCNAGDLTVSLYRFLTQRVGPNCYILGIDIDPTLIERANERNTNEKITFISADFMNGRKRDVLISNYLTSICAEKFSATFCFSITMWIHLNHGDAGLEKFLKDITSISKMLVIEPQPWKCYKSAVKRMKLSNEEFPAFKDLKIRNNVEDKIEDIVSRLNNVKITETTRTSWGRKLLVFKTQT